ncbi:MAG: hypothetical protein KDA81_10750, partial [Planctomycetaceae bacterium]|nr:hypothetical protein [Planctomycetaceae bacterium]
ALLELERGNIERALNLFKESEHIERQIGNFESVVVCLGNQALIAARLGDFHRALDIYKEQETIYRDSGNRHGLQISLGNQSEVYIEWGDFERAFALLREKERICRELVLTESLVKCLANQASLLCRVARAGDAVTLADEAYLLVERHGLVTLRKSIKEVLEFSRTLADARGSAASFVRDETGQQRLTIAKPPELRDLYYIEHPTKGLWSIDGILDGERCRIVLLMFSSQTALEVAHCAQKMMGEQLKLKKMADGWKMREKVRNTIIEGASMDIPMACLEEGAPQFKEMLDCIQTFLR